MATARGVTTLLPPAARPARTLLVSCVLPVRGQNCILRRSKGAGSSSLAVSWRGSHTPGSAGSMPAPCLPGWSTDPSDPSCQWTSGQGLCPVPCWALSFHLLQVQVSPSPKLDPEQGQAECKETSWLAEVSTGRVTGSSPGIPCCKRSSTSRQESGGLNLLYPGALPIVIKHFYVAAFLLQEE